MTWIEHIARVGEMRTAYKILVGKPEGMRLVGRTRCRWGINIGMDLREIRWEVVDWIHLVQHGDQWRAVGNTVMNLRVPQKLGSILTS
jgi:hypothetical protein